MALEKGIAELVREFIDAGRPHRANRILMTGDAAISPVRYWLGNRKSAFR
jgi:hypothetical protein